MRLHQKRLLSYTLTPDLKNLEETLAKLQAEKEEAINHQDFERAAKYGMKRKIKENSRKEERVG